MSRQERFNLRIDPPRSGSVLVWIEQAGQECTLDPSYLSDALGDLALAAAEIAARRGSLPETQRFEWQDEPGAWEWLIDSSDDDALSVRILRHRDTFPPRSSHGEEILRLEVPAERFCRSVLRAFDAISGQMDPEAYYREWKRSRFPEASLARLRKSIGEWDSPPTFS